MAEPDVIADIDCALMLHRARYLADVERDDLDAALVEWAELDRLLERRIHTGLPRQRTP